MTTRNPFSDGSNVIPIGATEMFDLIDPGAWSDVEPPAREWMLEGWLPRRRAGYLTGAGGAGKSLFGQQLATCIALGIPFLGLGTTQASAIYLTAEDDHDELQRRQRAICRQLNVSEADLSMKFFPISLFGRASNEMVAYDRDAGMVTLPAWQMLKNTARMTLTKLIVLDNVSHIFAGSEIDGTVLLIGHPNKQGDAYSGSTAWENAFRARLYFDAPKDAHSDPDARQLSLPKANYARKGAAIDVRWYEGALVRDDELPASIAEQIRQVSAHTAANDAFLRCLDVATEQKRAVSHVPGVNYAPKIFTGMTVGRAYPEEAYKGAMERLVHLGLIAFEQRLWRGDNYHWKVGIARADGVRQPPANPLAGDQQERQNSAISDPPTPARDPSPLKGGMGEPSWEGSPIPDPDELDWT